MHSKRSGFTLIEVALFLAITGILFASVTIGVQNSIFQQRENDAVQNFVEFLKTAYSETMNVESLGGGRSEKAIYGKLITFGATSEGKNAIYTYDVVGDIGDVGTGSVIEALRSLNADVTISEDGSVKPAGIVENYKPRWSAMIEKTDSFTPFVGEVMIIRHPKSGTIYTFVRKKENDPLNIEEAGALKAALKDFSIENVDFCVNPTGGEKRNNRRDVRIVSGARNSTGVQLISDNESLCNDVEN